MVASWLKLHPRQIALANIAGLSDLCDGRSTIFPVLAAPQNKMELPWHNLVIVRAYLVPVSRSHKRDPAFCESLGSAYAASTTLSWAQCCNGA